MTAHTSHPDLDELHGRVVRLEHYRVPAIESDVDELKKDIRGVEFLAHEVRRLSIAVGLSERLPVPDDWEEITQVKRPYLRKVQHQAKTRPWWAGAAVGLVWVIVELVKAIVSGHIQLH